MWLSSTRRLSRKAAQGQRSSNCGNSFPDVRAHVASAGRDANWPNSTRRLSRKAAPGNDHRITVGSTTTAAPVAYLAGLAKIRNQDVAKRPKPRDTCGSSSKVPCGICIYQRKWTCWDSYQANLFAALGGSLGLIACAVGLIFSIPTAGLTAAVVSTLCGIGAAGALATVGLLDRIGRLQLRR